MVGYISIAVIFVFLVGIWTLWYFWRIKKLIREMLQACRKVKQGDLQTVIKVEGGGQIAELSREFNEMIENLQKSRAVLEEAKSILEIKFKAKTRELLELASGLEQEVQRRTKEVKERMAELEKFNKLAVGRELKMIELKQEIERLKKGLKNNKI